MEGRLYEPEKIKEMFINGGKTRFSVLKYAVTESELLKKSTTELLDIIYLTLGLRTTDFNVKSFYKWLYRYKKTHKSVAAPDNNQIRKEEIKPKERIKLPDFKFTNPSTIKREEEPLFTIVKPGDF